MKKLLICLLIMSTAFIPSCTKEDNKGAINDVDISQVESNQTPDATVFSKIDNPFPDYSYTTIKNPKAHVSFEVPSGWEVIKNHTRCICLQAPYDDKHFPNATTYMLWNYNIETSEEATSDTIRSHDAFYFTDFFAEELGGLRYGIKNGDVYSMRYYEGEDEICPTPSFVGKNDSAVQTLLTKTIDLMDKDTVDFGPSGYGYAVTMVRWNGIPVSISTIVDTDNLDNARKLQEYIASSFTYINHQYKNTKTVTYDDFELTIPSEFIENESGNVWLSPVDEFNATAGMGVGVFEIDIKKGEAITKDNLVSSFAKSMGAAFYQGEKNIYTASAAPLNNGTVNYDGYTGNCDNAYSCIYYYATDKEAPSYAGTVYGMDEIGYIDLFVFNISKNKQKVIAVGYDICQTNLAKKIDKLVLNSYHLK